jgi:hypothetical protein
MQLRNLLTSLMVGALLLVFAASTYPFCPQNLLLLTLMGLGGLAAVSMATFLVQLNRDEFVSRVMGTTPNHFTPDWAFAQSIGKYVLPIVAAIMIQFPALAGGFRLLVEPVEPILHIIH